MPVRTSLAAAVAFLLISSVANAAPDFKEGEWSVNYSMEVVGMPFAMPPITSKKKSCLNKDNYVPSNAQEGQACKLSDQKVDGNTVTWSMHCVAKEGVVEGQGMITYRGERYDGVMDAKLISTGNPDMPIRYKFNMDGQRLGACPK